MIVQDRILVHLREKSGVVVDAADVAERIARDLPDLTKERIADALAALRSRGLVEGDWRRAQITEKGWAHDVAGERIVGDPLAGGSADKVAAMTGPAGLPVAKAPDGQERHSTRRSPQPAPSAAGPADEGARPSREENDVPSRTLSKPEEAIVRALAANNDVVTDPAGKCVPAIAAASGMSTDNAVNRLRDLERLGVLEKDSQRGVGTKRVALTAEGKRIARSLKEVPDGQVPVVSGGDRVGSNGQRKARPARREAGAPSRPKATQRRGGGRRGTARKAPAGRGRRRDGGAQRVDQPLHDVPARGPSSEVLSVAGELERISAIVSAFDQLSQTAQQYVVSALAEQVLGRA